TSNVTVTVIQTVTKVVINPSQATTFVGQSFGFTAQALDQFNKPVAAPLLWSASAGTISQTGSFISNLALTNVSIQATAPNSVVGLASITVQALGTGSGGVIGDISHAKPYPVPYKANSGAAGITFTNLAPGTVIKLFTTNGH